MTGSSIRSRPARGAGGVIQVRRDPEAIATYLEDAAHFPGGHARGLAFVSSERDIAELLASGSDVLPVGAQSSLTGAATPMGELLLSTARLNRIPEIGPSTARVQAGVTLAELDAVLDAHKRYYPPAPTFHGAFVGGTVATNAAGAATFKYGTTRDWVQALTIVLPTGDVLDVERGTVQAHDGAFDLQLADCRVCVAAPRYSMPRVPKVSAGYFSRPKMDLIDLFIGSEGTLGVVTEVTVRILSERPAFCLAFVPFTDQDSALRFVRALREAAHETWRTRDPRGVDIAAIEHFDRRILALLREDGIDRLYRVRWPDETVVALLVTLELSPDTSSERAYDEIGRARDANAPDTPLVRFFRMMDGAGALDDVEIAVPGDRARAAQLVGVREAAPAAVNQRVARAKQTIDPRIEKTAADMIVPFERIEEFMCCYVQEFGRRGLDWAVWGHISDGNVHPNVIPRSLADVDAAKAAILELGRVAIRLGGSPLAEHGVGRNPIKQQLLRELYGDAGIEDMRRIKRAIDPAGILSPGVLFPRTQYNG
jgi:D-lactate dehydrogenase (cytochrome)